MIEYFSSIHKLQRLLRKNTFYVLQWFKNLTFISFDVMEFYPLITEDLLGRGLHFASTYVTISAADNHVIMHAKQSLLIALVIA